MCCFPSTFRRRTCCRQCESTWQSASYSCRREANTSHRVWIIGHHNQAMNGVRTEEPSPAASFSGCLKIQGFFVCRGHHWQISNQRWQCCPGVKEQEPTAGFNALMPILTSQSTSTFVPSFHHMPYLVLGTDGTVESQTEKQAGPPV